MNIRFGKKIHIFYSSILFLLLSVLCFGIYYFWYSGPVNIKNISSVYEASLKVNEFKSKKNILDVKKMVESDQIGNAMKTLDDFEKGMKSIDHVGHVKESYIPLQSSIISVRKSLHNLLSLSNLTTLIFVFHEKISKFEKLALKSRWPALTRTSNKVRTKVNPGKLKTPGFFNYKKLSIFSRSIEKDISYMEKIVNRSLLQSTTKTKIVSELNSLRTELVMMIRYVEKLKEFDESFKKMAEKYKPWIQQAGAEVSLKKISFSKSTQVIIVSLLCLMVLLACAIVGGMLIYKKNNEKDKKEMENVALEIARKAIIAPEMKLSSDFNKSFIKDIKELRDYFHNRLSFGSIFQESLPFASILLDSNLKLVWANPLFYYQWNLDEEKTGTSLTWDYVKEFTNLGKNDPVALALNENVAGIYQIQIEDSKNKESTPLEMFVSPSFNNDVKRVMIFFYPLKTLEQTISEQTSTLVSPIVKCLDAFSMERFNHEFQGKIKNEFTVAGIGHIYEKFLKHSERMENQKNGLLKEIERMENELLDQYKLTEDLKQSFDNKLRIEKSIISAFKETRDQVVVNVDVRMNMEKNYQEINFVTKELLDSKKDLLVKSEVMEKMLQDNEQYFKDISSLKLEIKQTKTTINGSKLKLIQLLDQMLIFDPIEFKSVEFNEGFNKIKLEIKGMEKILEKFSTTAGGLEMALSKIDLVMDGRRPLDFSAINNNYIQTQNTVDNHVHNIEKIQIEGQQADEDLINVLKKLYDNFSSMLKQSLLIQELIAEQTPELPESEKRPHIQTTSKNI